MHPATASTRQSGILTPSDRFDRRDTRTAKHRHANVRQKWKQTDNSSPRADPSTHRPLHTPTPPPPQASRVLLSRPPMQLQLACTPTHTPTHPHAHQRTPRARTAPHERPLRWAQPAIRPLAIIAVRPLPA
jgi:hypothetical protein